MLKIAQAKKSPKGRQRKKSTKNGYQNFEKEEAKITDYFPTVRRSERKSESALKKEKLLELENAIVACDEKHLEVVHLDDKGRGVTSTRKFNRGEFVVEYKGELIEREMASKRERLYEQNDEIGCYMYYFEHNNKNYCVDATAETKYLGRLVNHSAKDPNCATKIVCIRGVPHLILVAARDINVGEELLYDYGDRNKESIAANPWLIAT